MNKILRSGVGMMILLMLLIGNIAPISAQPGGRGGAGDGPGNRDETPPIQNNTENRPAIGGNTADIEIPTDFSDIQMPDTMPATDELTTMMEEMELPISLDDLELPGSSAEAYTGLVGFGQTYLGTTIDPLYASSLNTAGMDMEFPAELTSITSELPVEVVAILTTAEGLVYWGVYQPGAAAVYILLNCNDNCTVTMENIQATLTDGSLGVYSVYTETAVNNDADAQNLILNTYPLLGNYTFEPYAIEVGYAFTSSAVSQGSNLQATGFIAGVVDTDNGQSLVYVVYGVGEGYADLVR